MYAKVFAQIYDGTLCTRGPWEALVTFQQFLVLADMDGVVDMTAAAIARRTTIPIEIIERGICELVKPDHESRTPTEEGRRLVPLAEGRSWGWRVVNYAHYRELKREEDRREYHRQYWHKRKLKISTDSTDSTETQHAQQNQPKQKQKQKQKQEDTKESATRVVARGARLPPDWTPGESGFSFASQQGLTNGRAALEAEKFRDYWTAATGQHASKADWQAAWRTWVRKSVEMEGNTFPKAHGEPAWRKEQRERTEAFAGKAAAKRPSEAKEILDVVAKQLD